MWEEIDLNNFTVFEKTVMDNEIPTCSKHVKMSAKPGTTCWCKLQSCSTYR